jgi:hypothetical protein
MMPQQRPSLLQLAGLLPPACRIGSEQSLLRFYLLLVVVLEYGYKQMFAYPQSQPLDCQG